MTPSPHDRSDWRSLILVVWLAMTGAACATPITSTTPWRTLDSGTVVVLAELLSEHVVTAEESEGTEMGTTVTLYDRASGRELWRTEVPVRMIGARVVTHERSLFVGTDEYVFALSLSSGKRQWVRGPFVGPIVDMLIDEHALAAAFDTDGVVRLRPRDGRVLWAYDPDDSVPLHLYQDEDATLAVLRRIEPDSTAVRLDVVVFEEDAPSWSEAMREDDQVLRSGDWLVVMQASDLSELRNRAVPLQAEEPSVSRVVPDFTALAHGQRLDLAIHPGRLVALRLVRAFDFAANAETWHRAWPRMTTPLRIVEQRRGGVLTWAEGSARVDLIDREGVAIGRWRLGAEDAACTPQQADVDALLLRCEGGRVVAVVPSMGHE